MDTAPLLALARDRRASRARLAAAARLSASRHWQRLDRRALIASWDGGIGRDITVVTTAAQLQAARGAQSYVDTVLALQAIADDTEGAVAAEAFAGIASDGRSLAGLLRQALLGTLGRVGAGVGLDESLEIGERTLGMYIDTQVTDAGRQADSVSLVRHRTARGYVRTLTPPSCARCAVLAGRIYSSERAFPRHPRCDCVHLPVSSEDTGDALKTNVRDYFDSLSAAQQDRIFTRAGAQAIRDGADINQVVNARRGMSTAGSFLTRREGPELFGRNDLTVTHRGRVTSGMFTTEGMTRAGFAGRRTGPLPAGSARLMPEGIYQLASDRDEVIRLLRRYGYLS